MNLRHACQALVLAFSVTACQPFFPIAQHGGSTQGAHQVGTIKVTLDAFQPKVTASGYGIQALPIYAITHAKVEVSGVGVLDPLTKTVPIGAGLGYVEIENVPLGKNRVVTATGLTSADPTHVVRGAVVRDVVDVNPGDNPISLTWAKTPAAEVFVHLAAADAAVATSTSATPVKNLVNTLLTLYGISHPSLVDTAAIAQDIVADAEHDVPAADAKFRILPATVTLVVKGLATAVRFDAWVDDPASAPRTNLPGGSYDLTGIKPGTWTLHVSSPDFGHIQKELTIARVPQTTVEIDFSGTVLGNIDFTNGNSPAAPPQPENFAPASGSYVIEVTP